jgi:hypothetical protein
LDRGFENWIVHPKTGWLAALIRTTIKTFLRVLSLSSFLITIWTRMTEFPTLMALKNIISSVWDYTVWVAWQSVKFECVSKQWQCSIFNKQEKLIILPKNYRQIIIETIHINFGKC